MSYPDNAGLAVVVTPGDAETVVGGSVALLAQTDVLAANTAVLRDGAPGVPPHYHLRSSEIFFVVSGALEALAGEEIVTVPEGGVLVVGTGLVHAIAALPGADVHLHVVTTPPAERFAYYRLLDRVVRGDAKHEELAAEQERFDSYFVDSTAAWSDRPSQQANA